MHVSAVRRVRNGTLCRPKVSILCPKSMKRQNALKLFHLGRHLLKRMFPCSYAYEAYPTRQSQSSFSIFTFMSSLLFLISPELKVLSVPDSSIPSFCLPISTSVLLAPLPPQIQLKPAASSTNNTTARLPHYPTAPGGSAPNPFTPAAFCASSWRMEPKNATTLRSWVRS